MTFSKLGQPLLDGRIDLNANNYWLTPERERLYAFTIPYYVRGGVGSLWIEGTGVLKKMWVDGSLNKIKRVYLDPLEIEAATSP